MRESGLRVQRITAISLSVRDQLLTGYPVTLRTETIENAFLYDLPIQISGGVSEGEGGMRIWKECERWATMHLARSAIRPSAGLAYKLEFI